ncbi:hypothetical protein ABT354_35855 [Streptomyces sp. NPDC000594]|uniref:hypothetical protein n=1 Tax=Streptomyces sp. NPDC000594 TaxID=3154261 RepID=UPI0033304B21
MIGDSATVLDVRLSPRARLLYAVLLAKLASTFSRESREEELLQELPVLVGLADEAAAEVQLLAGELVEYGVPSRVDHVVRNREPMWRVHPGPLPTGNKRRVCRPCAGCGACVCAEISMVPFPGFMEPQRAPCREIAAR